MIQQSLTQQAFRTLNSVVRPLVKAGVGSPLPIGLGAVVVETTGRVSGKPRQVPLLGVRFGDDVIVSTFRSDSQWLKNAEHDENTSVWLCGKKRSTVAEVTRGPLNIMKLSS